jgi:DNA-binding LacI/PurR family transcriptional regulator
MADVAARAGVSRPLVSIVFRNRPGASATNRERVLAAAAELGYAPDLRARLLSRSRSGLLGVVFGLHQEFHSELVEALYAAAASEGYEVAVGGFAPSRDERQAVAGLLAYRCEALVLLGTSLPTDELAARAAQVPTVAVARHVEVPLLDVVRTDDVTGARLATEHLLSLGHTRIAYLSGGRVPGDAERRRGYRAGMRAAGLRAEERILSAGLTEEAGSSAATALLAQIEGRPEERPTAVLAFNDRCALGVLSTFAQHGVRVPQDISLVGYDDTRVASLPWADLTTVRQDAAALSAEALRLALSRIQDDQPAREVVVEPSLVRRSSTARPA